MVFAKVAAAGQRQCYLDSGPGSQLEGRSAEPRSEVRLSCAIICRHVNYNCTEYHCKALFFSAFPAARVGWVGIQRVKWATCLVCAT